MSVTKLEELVFKKQDYNKSERNNFIVYFIILFVFIFVQFEIDQFGKKYSEEQDKVISYE